MEQGFEATPPDEATTEGERIHQWLDQSDSIVLTPAEMGLAREMETQRLNLMDFVFPDWQDHPPTVNAGEERIWSRGHRYSGRPDFLAIRNRVALLVDYKCGRIQVSDAKDNGQLRWYVALIANQYSFDTITVAIIQPRCGPFTSYTMDKAEINRCRARVNRTLKKLESPNPPLKAGEAQCRYCKAIAICPEVEKKSLALQRVSDIEALTSSQLSGILDIIPSIERKCEALRERAKLLLTLDPKGIPGYQLCEAKPRRYIHDAHGALRKAVEGKLLSPAEFLSCCSTSVTKLVDAVERSQGHGPAEAGRVLATILGSELGSKQGDPILRKAKK